MSPEFSGLREFGSFRLDPTKKVLWANNEPVSLPLKEIELLCVLTDQGRDVVTKAELLEMIWGDAFVEESNLSQHVYRLRKMFRQFGEPPSLIQTIPRRGYRFAGEVTNIVDHHVVIERHEVTRTVLEERSSLEEGAAELSQSRHPRWGILSLAVAGVVLMLSVALGAAGYLSLTSAGTIDSVGVIALRSLDPAGTEDPRAAGLTDALINQLGRADGLRVISLRSAEGFGGADPDPAAIGRAVGVEAVLDGTMQQHDGELRISLRLIRSRDGLQIWTSTMREKADAIFRIQDDLALETARALSRTIRPELVRHPTEDRSAYEAYLRGRFLLDKRSAGLYPKAKEEFELAIGFDPGFAAAYSGLADVFALQANLSSGARRDELYNRSKAAALKALEIDPQSAEARTSLGWVKRVHEWDWQAAEAEFRKAIDIDPNYVTARQWYALLLTSLGRLDEALLHLEKAREIEPFSRSVLMNSFSVRLYRGEKEHLRPLAEQLDDLHSPNPANPRLAIVAHFRNGEYDKVTALGEMAIGHTGGEIRSDYLAAHIAMAYWALNDKASAKRFIEHLERRASVQTEAAYRLAMAYGFIGDSDRAIALLEKCFNERDDRMVWLGVEHEFVRLRSDPRFKALLAKMRLG